MEQIIHFLSEDACSKKDYDSNIIVFDWSKKEVTVKGEKAISEIADCLVENKLDLCLDDILGALFKLGVVKVCDICGEIVEFDKECCSLDTPEPPEFTYEDYHHRKGDF